MSPLGYLLVFLLEYPSVTESVSPLESQLELLSEYPLQSRSVYRSVSSSACT